MKISRLIVINCFILIVNFRNRFNKPLTEKKLVMQGLSLLHDVTLYVLKVIEVEVDCSEFPRRSKNVCYEFDSS